MTPRLLVREPWGRGSGSFRVAGKTRGVEEGRGESMNSRPADTQVETQTLQSVL